MIAKIQRRPQARADIVEQFVYISLDNPDAGMRFLSAVEETIRLLAEMPGIGQHRYDVLNTRLNGLRSWRVQGFENYLIFYCPIDNGIEIIRVLHGARDLDSILDEER